MTEAQATVVEAVLQHVAEYTGNDVLDLPPLYDVIDPGALEKVTQKMERGGFPFTTRISRSPCRRMARLG